MVRKFTGRDSQIINFGGCESSHLKMSRYLLSCVYIEVMGVPQLTNTFKQVHHYRMCYECMVKWFEEGDYSFEHLNYLFKLKTLSRIFEYYSLIKLQLAIGMCGYNIKKAERLQYVQEDYEEDINNKYVFANGKYELTLLYEPRIWTDKCSEDTNLYSTGYNFSKGKWNEFWTPDFVIKVVGEFGEYYYIIDAKYSSFHNVKKIYMPELILKYSAQIASNNKYFSDVIGVGAIYPTDNDRIYYFKKNSGVSNKTSLPLFFSISVEEGDAGNSALSKRITQFLDVVDKLEYENIKTEYIDYVVGSLDASSVKSVNDEVSEEDGEEDTITLVTTKSSDGVIGIGDNLNRSQGGDVNEPLGSEGQKLLNVNGKRCFYYGKGKCLLKKGLCSANNSPCDKYFSNNEGNLTKEEYTCRNFTQYIKKGRTTRVECAISGKAGCVGIEQCKFYLKKK